MAARRISGRRVESGNAIAMLNNGDAAYPEIVAAIAGAVSSVGLSSYIFRVDVAGHSFITALTREAGQKSKQTLRS